MSFILEALRRADAQRESDPARGIHARPLPPASDDSDDSDDDGDEPAAPPAPLARRLLPWAVLLVAVLASLVAWRELRSPELVTRWAAGSGLALAGAPARETRAPVPARAQAPADAILPPPQAPLSSTRLHADGAGSPPAESTRIAAVPASGGVALAVAVGFLADNGLPADAPRVAITGGVHSSDAAQRMLVVDGQVVGEGGEPAPGLRVEEIRRGAAVLRWRGHRYQVAY